MLYVEEERTPLLTNFTQPVLVPLIDVNQTLLWQTVDTDNRLTDIHLNMEIIDILKTLNIFHIILITDRVVEQTDAEINQWINIEYWAAQNKKPSLLITPLIVTLKALHGIHVDAVVTPYDLRYTPPQYCMPGILLGAYYRQVIKPFELAVTELAKFKVADRHAANPKYLMRIKESQAVQARLGQFAVEFRSQSKGQLINEHIKPHLYPSTVSINYKLLFIDDNLDQRNAATRDAGLPIQCLNPCNSDDETAQPIRQYTFIKIVRDALEALTINLTQPNVYVHKPPSSCTIL
tara:strand:+ start:37738 stop:38613 length:876 start_codon:yes stop_codon:yes gene_type:complete